VSDGDLMRGDGIRAKRHNPGRRYRGCCHIRWRRDMEHNAITSMDGSERLLGMSPCPTTPVRRGDRTPRRCGGRPMTGLAWSRWLGASPQRALASA
jgi:hypothetical protein